MIRRVRRKLFAFDRSLHMKELHKSGRYIGTSRIGRWNQSDEKRERMMNLRSKNSLDKSSRGYGSEYQMRETNRRLLHNKFQSIGSGYLYLLEFPDSIKIGFSKDYERRTSYLGGKVIEVVSGPTNDLADLEFDIMIEFQEYTKLNSTGTRYTEYLDKSIKLDVKNFIEGRVKSNSTRLRIMY